MLFDYKTDLNVTERSSDDQHLGSLDGTIFCCKVLQSKKLTRSELLGGKFLCFHGLQYPGKQVTREW